MTCSDYSQARQVFLALNDKFPEDMAVVLELQGVLRALNDTGLLITIMERAMHLLQLAHPSGHGVASDGYDSPGGGFGESAIAILADFCHEIGEYEKAILVVRNGMRWLQGRLEQRFWDGVLDDREYDAPGMPRVETTGGPVGFPLSLNLRQRLAVSRIKIGDLDEGKVRQPDWMLHGCKLTVLVAGTCSCCFRAGCCAMGGTVPRDCRYILPGEDVRRCASGLRETRRERAGKCFVTRSP